MIRQLDDRTLVSDQIRPEEIAGLAAQHGVTMLVNNRPDGEDADAFEAKALAETGLDTADVPPRYRSSYFLHIWGNGYSAGYYAYQWTKMLDANAYDWFERNGGMTRANGQRLRDLVLSRGHTQDYSVMFRNMTGQDPELAPLLRSRGLTPQ